MSLAVAVMLSGCSVPGVSSADDGPEGRIGSEVADAEPAGATATANDGNDDDGNDDDGNDGGGDQAGAGDGSLFSRVDAPALQPDADRSSMNAVLAPTEDRGWLVAGSITDTASNEQTAAVWRSADPTEPGWERVDIGPLSNSDTMNDLAHLGGTDIAVGSSGRGVERRASVWVDDGIGRWTAVDRTQFDNGDSTTLFAIEASPETGQAVALGYRRPVGTPGSAALWRSEDGQTWSALADLGADDDADFTDVSVGPPGVVVTGNAAGSRTGFVAHSTDGESWTQLSLDPFTGATSTTAQSVTWNGEKYIVVGSAAPAGSETYQPVAWTSNDGLVWFGPHDDFDLIGDGRKTSGGYGVNQVEVAGDRLLATSSVGFMQQVWSSTDGRSWRSIGDVLDLRPEGFWASGVAGTSDFSLTTTGDASVVFNDTGWEETRFDGEQVPRPSSLPYVHELAATENGFVAVGGHEVIDDNGGGDTGLAWVSSDGLTWERTFEPLQFSWGPVNDVSTVGGDVVAVSAETVAHAIEARRSGTSRIWQGDAVGDNWVDGVLIRVNQPQRVFLESVTRVDDLVITGGWQFPDGAADSDALLYEARGRSTLRTIDLGFDGVGSSSVRALCSNGDSQVVAVITSYNDPSWSTAVAVRDGEGVWEVVEAADSSFDALRHQAGYSCAYGDDGVVIAGWINDGADDDVGLWSSPDGLVWNRVDSGQNFANGSFQWATSVTAVDGGYLVAGNDDTTGETLPVLWFGSGGDWRQVVVDAEAVGMRRLDVAVNGDTVVVMGNLDGAEQVYTASLAELRSAVGL